VSDAAAMVAFLEARLGEDEAAAREAYYEGQRWITEEEGVYRYPDDELVHSADRKADARHIARYDPARVLREVAAKRKILERYERAAAIPPSIAAFTRGQDDGYRQACLDALHDDAAVYVAHPGYNPAWAPD